MTDVPAWFTAALAVEPEHRDTEVDGCHIHLRCWGDEGRPGLLLIHGGAAHSGWWDHIAPFFADTYRVVAPDLSGHGDSGRREQYGLSSWATEAVQAARAGGIDRPMLVVGHSLGGWAASVAGVEHAGRITGAVILDSPLNDIPPEAERLARRRSPTRVYPTVEDALDRFTALPVQDVMLPYIGQHIAVQSLRAVDAQDGAAGGWTWKFDPRLYGPRRPIRSLLGELKLPVALFRSEHGVIGPEMRQQMVDLLDGRLDVVELPAAGHHPMLDQPLPLVVGLRTLFGQWSRKGGDR